MAGSNTLTFDDDNFETEVLASETPVLVDFWAQWCGPCLALAPVVDELAATYQGKVKIGKLDIDQSPQLAARFGVQSIPTLILFERGNSVEKIVGLRPKKDLDAMLRAKLGAGQAG